jgi:drug/metabolite transporter (DMT)-like permease
MKIAGILLILAGVAALVYGGFSYTSREKAVDLGAIQIDRTEHHTLPVPPILGIVAIAGGGLLVFFGAKERRRAR